MERIRNSNNDNLVARNWGERKRRVISLARMLTFFPSIVSNSDDLVNSENRNTWCLVLSNHPGLSPWLGTHGHLLFPRSIGGFSPYYYFTCKQCTCCQRGICSDFVCYILDHFKSTISHVVWVHFTKHMAGAPSPQPHPKKISLISLPSLSLTRVAISRYMQIHLGSSVLGHRCLLEDVSGPASIYSPSSISITRSFFAIYLEYYYRCS